jgi:O-antigen ligase
VSAAPVRVTLPLPLARRRDAAGATRNPWLLAVFLSLVFLLANHNFAASQQWVAATRADVSNLVERISEGSRLRQVAFLSLGGAGVLGLLLPARRRGFAVDLLVLYPLILLIGWCFLSVLWSQAPGLTLKRFVVLAAMTAAVLGMVRHYGLSALVAIAFTYGALALLIGIPAELAWRTNPLAPGYRFAGTMHPNHTGVCMVLLTLASLALADWEHPRRRWFFLVAAIGFAGLLATKSRTALFAGVFAVTVMTVLRWPLRRLLLVGLPALWTVLVVGTLYSLELIPPIWEKALLARQDSDASTLTGRTDIWAFSLDQLARDETRLFIGFGYDTFWTPQMARAVSDYVQFKISEGHSAYIDSVLELGLIGGALYAWCLFAAFGRWSWYAWVSKHPTAAFAAAVPAFAIVHGFAESATIDPHLWTLLLFATMAYAGFARPIAGVNGGLER